MKWHVDVSLSYFLDTLFHGINIRQVSSFRVPHVGCFESSIIFTPVSLLLWKNKDLYFYDPISRHCTKSAQIRSFFWPYFPVFGLNYSVNLRIQSQYRKIRIRKTPYLDTLHTVRMKLNLEENSPSSRL